MLALNTQQEIPAATVGAALRAQPLIRLRQLCVASISN
jgi:hypothetical protein